MIAKIITSVGVCLLITSTCILYFAGQSSLKSIHELERELAETKNSLQVTQGDLMRYKLITKDLGHRLNIEQGVEFK